MKFGKKLAISLKNNLIVNFHTIKRSKSKKKKKKEKKKRKGKSTQWPRRIKACSCNHMQ